MTKRPRRAVHGVILADKPVGPSSTQLLGRLKYLFQAEKAGHGGTLDPKASGLLPILFGEATKFAQAGLDADKSYLADIVLGQTSATGDSEGPLLEAVPVRETYEQLLPRLQAALASLEGEQDQIPPMHSALKMEGRPLYELAREGLTVERKARRITIFSATLVSLELDSAHETALARVQVRCSKGTYIRSFAEDLGRLLGLGGYLAALRRNGLKEHGLEASVTLETLEAAAQEGLESLDRLLLPVDALVLDWPRIDLDPESARLMGHGQRIQWSPGLDTQETIPKSGAMIRLYGPHNHFLGSACLRDGWLVPQRLSAVPTLQSATS